MDEIECIISGGSSMAEVQHQSAEQSSSSSRREEPHPPQPEDGWKIKIDEELLRFRQNYAKCHWHQHCIYRIPKQFLVSTDTNDDVPYFFSLGPYHTPPKFQDMNQMNQHKLRGLNRMLERTDHDVKQYLDPMSELKERALVCYEGPLDVTHSDATTMNENDPFVEMMMLDGCFILEMLQGYYKGFEELRYSKYDPIFTKERFGCSIGSNIIGLENQIPLFVLSRLLGIQLGNSDYEYGKVAEYAINFFESLSLTPNKSTIAPSRSDRSSSDEDQAKIRLHLLDVLRSSILKGVDSQPPSSDSPSPLVHCVTDLLKARVKFKKGDDRDKFGDVRFNKEVLTVPRIDIDGNTRSLLFNIIVYEQCRLECPKHITHYALLMDDLINSAKDVSYLRGKGIIEHCLGSDEDVANLFNKLCQQVDFESSYHSQLRNELSGYYGRKRYTWLAILKSKYFDNPWTIISVVAATVLLLFTAAQTFYTVYAYYKPAN